MADRAVVGYCHGGTVRAEFAASLIDAVMQRDSPVGAVLTYASGPNISTARNKICDKFLREYDAPWLLMADTDMVFAPDAPARLISAADALERPLLGALCWSQDDRAEALPVIYELEQKESGELAFRRHVSWPEDACVRVSATGAAFLLMHRGALEAIRVSSKDPAAPWFRESAVGAPLALMGEDLTFCLRAAAAGVPVHVHTGVECGHVKSVMLGKVN